jgi:mRNA-degrading endonuclease YafQ of YafQ-DinJ toxin-antitoxin module
MEIKYTEAFKRQLKQLSRRYRHIKKDIEPIIDAVIVGEIPSDQITGTDYIFIK